MANHQQPLSIEQQRLINIVRMAHQTLAIARKTKATESERRIAEAKIAAERALEKTIERIRMDLDAEVQVHAAALDEALIVAYDADIPVRRIALEGFGNRYDGGVHEMLRALRTDGRVGNKVNYQRNRLDDLNTPVKTLFPQPVDVDGILSTATTVREPVFTLLPLPLTLVEADANGDGAVTVQAVELEFDPRDPWFAQIERNARPGTPFKRATTCTLYVHPFSGELLAFESKETGEVMWDHPVARWVKEHREEALAGYTAAIAA